jgi:Homeodomain-like domain
MMAATISQHTSSQRRFPCILSPFVACAPENGGCCITKLRTSTLPVRLYQRYRIVAEALQGYPGPAIADRVGCNVDTVYSWLHRFNVSGFEPFERPTNPNGREPILTSQSLSNNRPDGHYLVRMGRPTPLPARFQPMEARIPG